MEDGRATTMTIGQVESQARVEDMATDLQTGIMMTIGPVENQARVEDPMTETGVTVAGNSSP